MVLVILIETCPNDCVMLRPRTTRRSTSFNRVRCSVVSSWHNHSKGFINTLEDQDFGRRYKPMVSASQRHGMILKSIMLPSSAAWSKNPRPTKRQLPVHPRTGVFFCAARIYKGFELPAVDREYQLDQNRIRYLWDSACRVDTMRQTLRQLRQDLAATVGLSLAPPSALLAKPCAPSFRFRWT